MKDFQLSLLNDQQVLDPFSIIQEFRAISGGEALKLSGENDELEREKYVDWDLEARFWDLVGSLLEFRTSEESIDEMRVHQYNSDIVFKKQLLKDNRGLFEIWLIKSWLEANMPVPERPASLSTSKWNNSMLDGRIQSMDADFVLRNPNVILASDDTTADREFFKYAFDLLLCGDYERLLKECDLTDNLSLSLILRGIEDYVDPKLDVLMGKEYTHQQGIKKRALWRRTVYALSQDESLDPYEAAIYTYLSGGPPEELKIQEVTWESDLLMYLNHIWNISVENYLIERGRIDRAELISDLASTPPSLSEVLNILASKYPTESAHPLRVLMGSIILDTVSSVIKSFLNMLLDVMKGHENESDFFNESYLLKVLTNLTIFLTILNPDNTDMKDTSKLISTYVSLLSFYGLYEIIPTYVGFLSDKDLLDTFSFFLSGVVDPGFRQQQISLSNMLQLPTSNVLRKTAQRIFEETADYYIVQNEVELTDDISGIDERLMNGIDLLIQGNLYTDAVETMVTLARRFLVNGKIKALETFFNAQDIPNILKEYQLDKLSTRDDRIDLNTMELEQYLNLINAFRKHEQWLEISESYKSGVSLPRLVNQFKEFSKIILDLVITFLVDLVDDKGLEDAGMLYEIRTLYVPYFIMELHNDLMAASQAFQVASFIQEAVELSILVANETDKIYLLFQNSGKLTTYLTMVAKASAVLGQ